MNEPDVLLTIQTVLNQTIPPKGLFVCVNQPEDYWQDVMLRSIAEQNQQTLQQLSAFALTSHTAIHIIDKASPGRGWTSDNHGVGWARKVLMDTIAQQANANDLIVSLDADTIYPPSYFESVHSLFINNPKLSALSNPYYHCLTDDLVLNKAVLRYEIYMRVYFLNLCRIGSPYAFTALGSAMAVKVDAYRRIGGISPKKSGEDFYFLQQLAKTGIVENRNAITVYPATRLSNRVFFGTGPALIKGVQDCWDSYPIYAPKLWDEISQLYAVFPQLQTTTLMDTTICETMQAFAKTIFTDDLLAKWRKTAKTTAQFVKFCHEKFDALRVLQYLKWRTSLETPCDKHNITENAAVHHIMLPTDFNVDDLSHLTILREALYHNSGSALRQGSQTQ
ncbi:hypothetical protein FACS1894201_03040 [Bacteroidia bacterium]|nr:hypothetical protein FACS1894201_03040 [Bacteroidia bacterium]